jgi:hypothetical protein
MSDQLVITDEATRHRAVEHVAGLSIDGKQWEVSVARKRKRRTLNQNALYWKWIGEVVDHVSDCTGYEKDEVHEYFKQRFLEPKAIEIDGFAAKRYTTTDCDTGEMAKYMDRIYRWASQELGLVLPLPPVATEERQ